MLPDSNQMLLCGRGWGRSGVFHHGGDQPGKGQACQQDRKEEKEGHRAFTGIAIIFTAVCASLELTSTAMPLHIVLQVTMCIVALKWFTVFPYWPL